MTETTPRASMCPVEGCHALIPVEYRRKHAEGHASDNKARKAMRDQLTSFLTLVAELKADNRDFRREINAIEIPEAVEPMVIEEWPDDDLPDQPDDDVEDDQPVSTYANDNIADTVALDPSDYPLAIDRDDVHPTPPVIDMYGNRIA